MVSLTRPSTWLTGGTASRSRLGSSELAARLLAFVIPVMIAIEVPGLGTIYLAELCLIGILPFLLVLRGRMLQSKAVAIILAMGLLYLGAQVITDVVRATPFGDYARGWSRILFLLCSFVSTYLLIGNDRARLLCYAVGLVVGAVVHVLINNPISSIGWKFGFAGPTTTLILIGFSMVPVLHSPRSLVGPAMLIALGVFSAFMDFRSWGGVLMLSAAFISIPAVLRLVGLRPKPLSYGRMMVMGAALFATSFGALKLYGYAAESGVLGEKSRQKYETQSALGDLGILLGGRSESLVTVQAIQDSPLIGHGSWAKDRYYAELRQLMLYRLGFANRFIEPENDLIPTHSHLLGSWVEAGVGGALFWAGILALIIRALRRLYASDDPLRPYLVFLMFLFIWDILFSPFGAQRRLTNGFLMVAVLFALKASAMNWRQRSSSSAPPSAASPHAIVQTAGSTMRPGLAEPPMPPWLAPVHLHPSIAVGVRDRMPKSLEDDRFLSSTENDAPDSGEVDDERGAPDIGSGGETIRAGFRRLRQRNSMNAAFLDRLRKGIASEIFANLTRIVIQVGGVPLFLAFWGQRSLRRVAATHCHPWLPSPEQRRLWSSNAQPHGHGSQRRRARSSARLFSEHQPTLLGHWPGCPDRCRVRRPQGAPDPPLSEL